MALRYLYSNIQITVPAHTRILLMEALNAAMPELPKNEVKDPFNQGPWYHWHFTDDHAGVCLNVRGYNQSQIGDFRQRAFDVVRKLIPGFNPKEVRHESGEILIPGRI